MDENDLKHTRLLADRLLGEFRLKPKAGDLWSILVSPLTRRDISRESPSRWRGAVSGSGIEEFSSALAERIVSSDGIGEEDIYSALEVVDRFWSAALKDESEIPEAGSAAPTVDGLSGEETMRTLLRALDEHKSGPPETVQAWRREFIVRQAALVANLAEASLDIYRNGGHDAERDRLLLLLGERETKELFGRAVTLLPLDESTPIGFDEVKSALSEARRIHARHREIDRCPPMPYGPRELAKHFLFNLRTGKDVEWEIWSLISAFDRHAHLEYKPSLISVRLSVLVEESGLAALCASFLGIVESGRSLDEGHLITLLETLDRLWSLFLGERPGAGVGTEKPAYPSVDAMTVPELIGLLQRARHRLPSSAQEWRREICLRRAASVVFMAEHCLNVFGNSPLAEPLKALEDLLWGSEARTFFEWASRLSLENDPEDLDFSKFKGMYLQTRWLISEIIRIDLMGLEQSLKKAKEAPSASYP